MNERLIDRLKKVRELALRGTAGERESAQQLFDDMVKKYNLQDYNFDDELVEDFIFTYHGKQQLRLLTQIYYKVTNNPSLSQLTNRKTGRRLRTMASGKCTEAQCIEINFMFDFYLKLLNEEEELFFTAFVQKHQLFGESKDGAARDEIDVDAIRRMYKMMAGMKDGTPTRQIGDGTDTTKTKKGDRL